jgi:tetratricopeptide (TPR) repeat protein
MAEIAIAKGDLEQAEKYFAEALEELRAYPALLVAWKTYAALGRLKLRMGDAAAAREAFVKAAEIIKSIAANVNDEGLHNTFMTSAAVKEVVSQAALDE